jgi:AraC-like DNA-binding protein
MRLTIDHLQMVESEPRTMQHSEPVVVQSQTESQDSSESVETSEAVNDFVEKATGLIVEHLSDSEFNIDRLCREMAMSRTLFYVKLKSYTGKSPQDFIRIIRLERAASMLRGGRNVTDVAALTGFDNPKYFSTVFKKYFGVSPSKYH